MDWSSLIAKIIWLIIGLITGLGIAYAIKSPVIGHQAALRELGTLAPSIILAIILVDLINYLLNYLPKIWRDYVSSGIFIFAAAFTWTYIATGLGRKRQAGSLLLHLERLSTQEISLCGGLLYLCGGLLFVILGIWLANWLIHQATLLINTEGFSSSTLLYLSLGIAAGSLGILFLVGGLTKLEIREHGIWVKLDLIEWNNISSYFWEGKNGNTLTIRLKKHFPFFPHRSLSFPIPISQKDKMNSIMQKKLSSEVENKKINDGKNSN